MLALPGLQPSVVDLADIAPIADTLRDCMLDSEEPFDGTMTLIHAQYLLAARAGVAAVMDGIDGDSLFLAGDSLARDCAVADGGRRCATPARITACTRMARRRCSNWDGRRCAP